MNQEILKTPEVEKFKYEKVYFQTPDLDTIGALFLKMRIAKEIPEDVPIEILRGDASKEILENPKMLCLEVGGSGEKEKGNYDHHGEGVPEESATLQVFGELSPSQKTPELEKLVNYVNELDTKGPTQLLREKGKPEFPTLSDIIAGIRLKHGREPETILKEGMKVLERILKEKQDPYGTISGFEEYAEVKRKNDLEIEKVVENIKWDKTKGGLNLGFVESEFPGATGAVYEAGRGKFGEDETILAVVFNPKFGPEKNERKFTIGLSLTPEEAKEKNLNLNKIAQKLNGLEEGWGGPASGTILGSPRGGSRLEVEEVLKILKENL